MERDLFLAAAFQRGEEWILLLEICLEASQESPLSVSSCLRTEHNGLYGTKA